jgi:hypothetical protein
VRRRTLIRDRETALEFAVDAYVYLYPLVLLDLARRLTTNVEGPGRAPANVFAHVGGRLPGSFRDVVRPDFDLLHSFAWLDVSRGPVIVSVPDAGDRYYLLPMIDMWSDLVAVPGTRTAGNWPADYAVVGPGWEGQLPERVRRIDAPTPYVWIVGHIQPDGRQAAAVDEFQSSLKITPLSRVQRHRRLWRHHGRRRPDPFVQPGLTPVEQVDAMSAPEFFTRGAELLRRNPPHVHDHAVLQRIERIGITAGEPLDLRALPRAVSQALPVALARGRFELHSRLRRIGQVRNGWQVCDESMGAWGTDYLKRAAVARHFLGSSMPEDVVQATAFVDGASRPLDGAHRYTLRFAPHELPPVRALWSLTAYDADGYAVPNPTDRYALGSQDALERGPDGAIALTIQQSAPRHGLTANWLPCPAGPFNLCLRLYRPEPEALDHTWIPPAVCRDERQAQPRVLARRRTGASA